VFPRLCPSGECWDVAGLQIGDDVDVRVLDSGDVLVTPVKASSTPARQVEVVIRPYLARAARAAGAVTVAAVVTPFNFEGIVRNRWADAVVDCLRRDADLVMASSNEDWFNRYKDDTPIFDVFDTLDRHVSQVTWMPLFPD